MTIFLQLPPEGYMKVSLNKEAKLRKVQVYELFNNSFQVGKKQFFDTLIHHRKEHTPNNLNIFCCLLVAMAMEKEIQIITF